MFGYKKSELKSSLKYLQMYESFMLPGKCVKGCILNLPVIW
jgi:hypothetical protein